MKNRNITYLNVSELRFDPQNPRFGSYKNKAFDDDSLIIKEMLDKEAVSELVVSIADQNYFPGEPLLVYKSSDDNYVVAEGNRRLSALKILNNEELDIPPSIKQIVQSAENKPESVPCIVFSERSEIIHYLGYRHITGVKSWGALEKAIYLKQLKNDLKRLHPNLSDDAIHVKLAREIGSHKPTVAKSLTALAIYENGRDESTGTFYELQRVKDTDVDFSLIYTALGLKNIWGFLGINSSSDTELHNFNRGHSKELFSWLFAQNDTGDKVVGESRQLLKLNHVLGNDVSLAILRESKDLSYAYDFSDGAEVAFEKLVLNSKKSLKSLEDFLEDDKLTEISSRQLDDIRDIVDLTEYVLRLAKRKTV